MLSVRSLTAPLQRKLQRSYTPPTCTLTVSARRVGSRRSPATANLRFELSFDDPRLTDEQQKTVRGDRVQLARLHESVSAYVRHFLAQQLESAYESPYATAGLTDNTWATRPAIASFPYPASATHLQPSGFVSHDLFLGTLATEETGAAIRLGTLQLFDLLSALEEYAADLGTLPEPEPTRDRPPLWVSFSAGVAVTAGLVVAMLRLDAPRSTLETAQSDTAANSTSQAESESPPSDDAGDEAIQPTSRPTPGAIATPPPLSAPSEPPPTAIAPDPIDLPPQGSAPPANSGSPSAPAPNATAPNPPAINLVPSQEPTVPPVAPEVPRVDFGDRQESQRADIAPSIPESAIARPDADDSFSGDRSTAFDTVPQVAELRRYFQNRWTPPDGLTQTLEYTLRFDASGTLVEVAPLGQAAVQFRDRAGIPPVGDRLVSPSSDAVQLRLVLKPNGQVSTFVQ